MSEQKIQHVAVIGGGISGVVSAAHLLAAGIKVTVFERNNVAGGVWLGNLSCSKDNELTSYRIYDDRAPIETQSRISRPSHLQEKEIQSLIHAPPG